MVRLVRWCIQTDREVVTVKSCEREGLEHTQEMIHRGCVRHSGLVCRTHRAVHWVQPKDATVAAQTFSPNRSRQQPSPRLILFFMRLSHPCVMALMRAMFPTGGSMQRS